MSADETGFPASETPALAWLLASFVVRLIATTAPAIRQATMITGHTNHRNLVTIRLLPFLGVGWSSCPGSGQPFEFRADVGPSHHPLRHACVSTHVSPGTLLTTSPS